MCRHVCRLERAVQGSKRGQKQKRFHLVFGVASAHTPQGGPVPKSPATLPDDGGKDLYPRTSARLGVQGDSSGLPPWDPSHRLPKPDSSAAAAAAVAMRTMMMCKEEREEKEKAQAKAADKHVGRDATCHKCKHKDKPT